MNKKYINESLSDETLAKLIDDTLNFKKEKKHSGIKTNLLRIIPAVAAIVLIIGFINILPLLMKINIDVEPDHAGMPNYNYFTEQEINLDDYTISLELPRYMSLENFDDNDLFKLSLSYLGESEIGTRIIKGGVTVGAVALAPVNVTQEMFETYTENPEQNYRAIYYPLPMGSMNFAGINYKIAYESENQREGSSTDLICFRSDFFDDNYSEFDLSRLHEEIIEGDPRSNYYLKSILGYNLDLGRIVVIELYYDAVTDEELTRMAESLRISGENNQEQSDYANTNSAPFVYIDFNISIRPEQYNENPFYETDIRKIIRSVEELKSLCKDETYAYTEMTGAGTEETYLRDLSQTYNEEYFRENALIAVSFESLGSIPKNIYKVEVRDNFLTAWAYQFEDMTLPENEKFTSGLCTERVFLVEVKKSDIENVLHVYPGIDGAPDLSFAGLPAAPPVEAPPVTENHPTLWERELIYSGEYKTIERYVRHGNNDGKPERSKITLEVPVEWDGDMVIGITDEDYLNIMKVDIWNILSATREDVLNEYKLSAMDNGYGEPSEIFDENIYKTENYEVFYYKLKGTEMASCIYYYYLYANGERFAFTGYVFIEDKPEYDAIFKRIAESVRFQTDYADETEPYEDIPVITEEEEMILPIETEPVKSNAIIAQEEEPKQSSMSFDTKDYDWDNAIPVESTLQVLTYDEGGQLPYTGLMEYINECEKNGVFYENFSIDRNEGYYSKIPVKFGVWFPDNPWFVIVSTLSILNRDETGYIAMGVRISIDSDGTITGVVILPEVK